jgi:hypothetical protein
MRNPMRRIFAIIILLCIIYFLGGWIAVYFNILKEETYYSFAGIVGGFASVVGLFSFTKPALTKSDLQEIELDSIKSIAKTTEELNKLEKKREKTQVEIGDLTLQKKEMELLVKNASLALFLKEQHNHYEEKILAELKENKELSENLIKIEELNKKINTLNQEIESDPNVDLLKEIINSSLKRELTIDDTIDDLPPILRIIFIIIREFSRALTSTTNIILK